MEELSRECLMETLDVFSGLKRIGGSEDEHRACGYLIKKLQEWGIPCRVYECDGYVSTPIEASVTVEGMDQTFEALPRSFSAHCPDGVTAPLFYDVHAHDQLKPRQEQDWYAGARGCIVIGDNFYEDYVQKLRGYGVKGLIHLWTSEEPVLHYETVSPVWGTAEPENGKTYPDFPVVGLRSCDRESILPLLTPGACSRTATVRSVLQCGCVRLQIPVAELAGETPEYVLVGSHYDSWDYGVTDNATGNAAVLELARVLSQKQLRRGVKIAWWPAHSNGRYAGSTWYCDEQFEDLDARCVALVNMDSPGCMGAQEIGFSTSGVAGDTLGDIVTPSHWDCMEGRQFSMFFDCLSRHEGRMNLYRVTNSKSLTRNEYCLNYTPTAEDTDFNVNVIRLDENTMEARETKPVAGRVHHPLKTKVVRNICICGDSGGL